MKTKTTNLNGITARDLMRTDLVTVPESMTLGEVERVLSENDISGAPVTDPTGQIVGVISLRDLVDRNAEDHDARADAGFWAASIDDGANRAAARGGTRVLADSESGLAADYDATDIGVADDYDSDDADRDDPDGEDRQELELERMVTGDGMPIEGDAAGSETARNVMTAQIHAVDADAPLTEIARVMTEQSIHRVLVRASRGSGADFVGMVTSTDVLRAVAGMAG